MMSDRHALTTTTLLLDSLKDSSQAAAWSEFDARYRPILTAFARRLGLGAADAEEVAQEALAEFLRAYREGRYDRGKGRLRSWLISIGQNTVLKHLRRVRRAPQRGASHLEDLSDTDRVIAIWEAEHERSIFARAWEALTESGRTADKTLRAFELVSMRGASAEAAAAECGMSLDEVYIAKNRVTARLRRIVEEMTAAYEEEQ